MDGLLPAAGAQAGPENKLPSRTEPEFLEPELRWCASLVIGRELQARAVAALDRLVVKHIFRKHVGHGAVDFIVSNRNEWFDFSPVPKSLFIENPAWAETSIFRLTVGVHRDKRTGKYYFRIHHKGKDYEKWFGKNPKDKFLAEAAFAEFKSDLRTNQLADQGWQCFEKMQKAKHVKEKTFGEAAKEYLEGRGNFKMSSIRAYKSILTAHLLPKFAKRTLRSISEADLRNFLVELTKEKGLTASRANTILQPLREMLTQAHREGEIDRHPSTAVKRLKVAKPKIQPFSEDDLALALMNIDPHYRPFFIVQAFTGARPNELLALRWSDIDGSISKSALAKVELVVMKACRRPGPVSAWFR